MGRRQNCFIGQKRGMGRIAKLAGWGGQGGQGNFWASQLGLLAALQRRGELLKDG